MKTPRKYRRPPDKLTVLCVTVIAASLLTIFWVSWGEPYVRYREGCRLMEAEEYDEAATIFACLPDGYLDAFQKFVACREAEYGPDYWSRPQTPAPEKPAPKPAPPAPSRRPAAPDDDPYNASDFSSEEDFYDYYSEDFADFYDAENYYRDHTED